MVDFGRELDGAESIHCMEDSEYTDYAELTYPIDGEYLITKRRYSAFSERIWKFCWKALKLTPYI